MNWKKFLGVLLGLFVALTLEFKAGQAFGYSIDAALVVLLVGTAFLGFWELIALVVLSIVLLNWQPAVSLELIVFALIPCAAFVAKSVLPWRSWLNSFVITLGGVAAFYFLLDPGFVARNFSLWSVILFADLVLGLFVFWALDFVYGSEA